MVFQKFDHFFLLLDKFFLDFDLFEITVKKFISFSKFFSFSFLTKVYQKHRKKANCRKDAFVNLTVDKYQFYNKKTEIIRGYPLKICLKDDFLCISFQKRNSRKNYKYSFFY